MRKESISNFSSTNKLLYFRVVLLVAAASYLLFGLIYKIYIPDSFPMSMTQRVVVSLFFLLILTLTYLSKWARERIEVLMYLAAAVAFSHLVYFSYLNDYRLNYALSVIVVLIVLNFLFQGNLRLKWFNVAVDTAVVVSVYLAQGPAFSRIIYVFSVICVSAASYFLSRSKHRAQEEYEQLFEDSPIGLVQCNLEGEVQYFNKEMLRLAGDPPEEKFKGFNIFQLLEIEKDDLKPVENREKLLKFPWSREVWVSYSVELIPKGGSRFRDIIIACQDISERKEAESKIEYMTYHDNLTGLYNRSFFQRKVERLGAGEYPLSVIFIDVDHLKLINDAFGHQLGDELLVHAAEVVQNSCREEDLVFRWGGDEIVILLPKTTAGEVEKIGSRLRNNCKEAAFEPIDLSLSIGGATVDGKGVAVEDVLEEAEERMYEKKMEKRDPVARSILDAILAGLKEKSSLITDHVDRVEKLSLRLGQDLNLRDDQLERLTLSARYHDIGKIALDEEIVNKNYKKLTDREKEELSSHAKTGYQISKELHHLSEAALSILHHHEWWNGGGYPQGKEGEAIPYTSRILSVANVYDFWRGRHSNFREELPQEEAKAKIAQGRGSRFDPHVVDAFFEII